MCAVPQGSLLSRGHSADCVSSEYSFCARVCDGVAVFLYIWRQEWGPVSKPSVCAENPTMEKTAKSVQSVLYSFQ
eukprot:2842994-Rhodomonas_salina.1